MSNMKANRQQLSAIATVMVELACDLESEVLMRYGLTGNFKLASQLAQPLRRRFERDMAIVHSARNLLREIGYYNE